MNSQLTNNDEGGTGLVPPFLLPVNHANKREWEDGAATSFIRIIRGPAKNPTKRRVQDLSVVVVLFLFVIDQVRENRFTEQLFEIDLALFRLAGDGSEVRSDQFGVEVARDVDKR